MVKLILFNVVVGAIIGLFTNWIAIVMLFRPWKEKRMFGKRMPLTPGLIPRRQGELAEKLGEIVERDLLTPEGLAKSLKRPAVEFAVKRAAIQSLADTLQESPTLEALATRWFGDEAPEKIEHFLRGQAVLFLRSDAGRAKLEQLADTLFDHLRGSLASENTRRDIARGFAAPLQANLNGVELTWQVALPEGIRLLVEERLQAQVDPFVEGTSEWLMNPSVINAISKMLTEKVESIPLIGSMAKGFLTPERVASDIAPRLQNVVRSHTTRDLMREKLHETITEFWARPVGQYLGRLSVDELSLVLEKMLHVLLERLFTEQIDSREKFRVLFVSGFLEGANEHSISDVVRRLLDEVLRFDVRALYITHTDNADRLVSKTWHFLRGKLIDLMPEIVETLAIRQVVSEQVASFPIPTLEKLIVSVVNSELKMITYLGGVLGAIIGLIQSLIALG